MGLRKKIDDCHLDERAVVQHMGRIGAELDVDMNFAGLRKKIDDCHLDERAVVQHMGCIGTELGVEGSGSGPKTKGVQASSREECYFGECFAAWMIQRLYDVSDQD